MEFLPKNYEEPVNYGNYAKLEEGPNQFRILGSAIIGWEWWEDSTDEKGQKIRRPRRVKDLKEATSPELKHFWAFPVYNYKASKIQILELTQKGIKQNIKGLVDNPKWGDPRGYDIVITRIKTGPNDFDVDYTVQPDPKEELNPEISAAYEEMEIDMGALYSGEDPFAKYTAKKGLGDKPIEKPIQVESTEDAIDIDEVEKALGI